MKQTRLKIYAVFLFNFVLTGLQAQQAVSASGGEAFSSGGSMSYTVGQVVYTTSTGTDGTVTPGVHQPFEISEVTEISKTSIHLQCRIYPNPTTNYLQLEVENNQFDGLSYQLFDTKGTLIESNKILSKATQIKTEKLIQGSYLLQITQKDIAIKAFKIVKN